MFKGFVSGLLSGLVLATAGFVVASVVTPLPERFATEVPPAPRPPEAMPVTPATPSLIAPLDAPPAVAHSHPPEGAEGDQPVGKDLATTSPLDPPPSDASPLSGAGLPNAAVRPSGEALDLSQPKDEAGDLLTKEVAAARETPAEAPGADAVEAEGASAAGAEVAGTQSAPTPEIEESPLAGEDIAEADEISAALGSAEAASSAEAVSGPEAADGQGAAPQAAVAEALAPVAPPDVAVAAPVLVEPSALSDAPSRPEAEAAAPNAERKGNLVAELAGAMSDAPSALPSTLAPPPARDADLARGSAEAEISGPRILLQSEGAATETDDTRALTAEPETDRVSVAGETDSATDDTRAVPSASSPEAAPQEAAAAAPARDLRSDRLPQIGTPPIVALPPELMPGGSGAAAPALQRNARVFDNPENKPPFVILLRDTADPALDLAALAASDLPMTLIIDPSKPGAAARAAIWREAGQEVALLSSALPKRATPTDVEVTLEALERDLPQALAIVEAGSGPEAISRDLAGALVPGLKARGFGMVTWDAGLKQADQVARREALPAARIFRDLDAKKESAPVIRRYLDRAAFKAQQDGHVLVVGDLRSETLAAVHEWSLEGRVAGLALAPLSAVLAPRR